ELVSLRSALSAEGLGMRRDGGVQSYNIVFHTAASTSHETGQVVCRWIEKAARVVPVGTTRTAVANHLINPAINAGLC
ncbi:MAG: hypothetical protein AAF743_06705, partial [Planctomycetota bacterium]